MMQGKIQLQRPAFRCVFTAVCAESRVHAGCLDETWRIDHYYNDNGVYAAFINIAHKAGFIIVIQRLQLSSFFNTTLLALVSNDDVGFVMHCSKLVSLAQDAVFQVFVGNSSFKVFCVLLCAV